MSIGEQESSSSLESEVRFIEAGVRSLDIHIKIPLSIRVDDEEEECPARIKKAAEFLLNHLCQPANDPSFTMKFPDPQDLISVFFSVTVPEISVSSYLNRWQLYSKCSPSTFIYALIYLRRVEEADCRLTITAYTMHRLLTTSILVAAKFLEEAWHSNAFYGRVGGMGSVQEMNRLELVFLRLLKFRTYVPQYEFDEMVEFGLKGANGAKILSTRLRLARL